MDTRGINTALAVSLLAVAGLSGFAHARPSGSIAVDSPIERATVEVDGRAVGKTPLPPTKIAAGKHTLKVRKLGYLDFSQTIHVTAGRTLKVAADLVPFAGILKASANVASAQVSVDGKVLGRVPLESELKIGKRTVTLSAPGYQPYVEVVVVSAGQTYTVAARLEKGSAVASADDLALEPLSPASAPAGSRALPEDKRASAGKHSGSVDDLALEPLHEPAARSQPRDSATASASPPSARPTGAAADAASSPALTQVAAAPVPARPLGPGSELLAMETVAPAKPWYMERWVWGAAAATVVTGVVAVILLRRSGGESGGACSADAGVRFFEGGFDPCAD